MTVRGKVAYESTDDSVSKKSIRIVNFATKMEIVKFGQQLNTPLTLALGYFETMHLGHTALIAEAKKVAAADGSKVGIFTFDRKTDKETYTFDERMLLYRNAGVDYVVVATFDKSFAATKGADFLKKLNSTLNVNAFVCGFDYTFGNDRLDNFDLTRLLDGKQRLFICKPVTLNGVKVCSSAVRRLIADGKVDEADKLLSQPYFVCGKVCSGRGVGHKIGFATANVRTPDNKILPRGVFVGVVHTQDGKEYKAIVNIGNKPTFGIDTDTVEAHLLDFDGNLYGQNVQIDLLSFLRPIRKFDDEQALADQLRADEAAAKGVNNDQIRS